MMAIATVALVACQKPEVSTVKVDTLKSDTLKRVDSLKKSDTVKTVKTDSGAKLKVK